MSEELFFKKGLKRKKGKERLMRREEVRGENEDGGGEGERGRGGRE